MKKQTNSTSVLSMKEVLQWLEENRPGDWKSSFHPRCDVVSAVLGAGLSVTLAHQEDAVRYTVSVGFAGEQGHSWFLNLGELPLAIEAAVGDAVLSSIAVAAYEKREIPSLKGLVPWARAIVDSSAADHLQNNEENMAHLMEEATTMMKENLAIKKALCQ